MTASEAVDQITSERKFYVGIMNQSTASHTIKRFRNGSITLNKLREFLGAFGYIEENGGWRKVTKEEKARYSKKILEPEISYK